MCDIFFPVVALYAHTPTRLSCTGTHHCSLDTADTVDNVPVGVSKGGKRLSGAPPVQTGHHDNCSGSRYYLLPSVDRA